MVGVKQLEDDNLLAKCANAIPKQSKLPQFLEGSEKDYFHYLSNFRYISFTACACVMHYNFKHICLSCFHSIHNPHKVIENRSEVSR